MRHPLESLRLHLCLAAFRYKVTCGVYNDFVPSLQEDPSFKKVLSFIASIAFLLLFSVLQILAVIAGVAAGILIDIIWYTLVPLVLLSFNLIGCPTIAILNAHFNWKDCKPLNSNDQPLKLIRFRGNVEIMKKRWCVFTVKGDIDEFDEVFRVFRVVCDIDRSVYVARTHRVVFIYNASPYAHSNENNKIHLPIPKRGDIRKRSWLTYEVEISSKKKGKNDVHNCLINVGTFNFMNSAIRDCYNILDNGTHFSIMNTTKSFLVPLVPAALVSLSFRITNWQYIKWVGDNEIEIFFGVIASVSLFRVLRQDAPIQYRKLAAIPKRIEHVARVATIRPNNASPRTTSWYTGRAFGSEDCLIKNGMEALMLASILIYEDHEGGKLRGICIDRNEGFEIEEYKAGKDQKIESTDTSSGNNVEEDELDEQESEGRHEENEDGKELRREVSLNLKLLPTENPEEEGKKIGSCPCIDRMKEEAERERTARVDSAVQKFNEQWDGNIPPEVWLGRPWRPRKPDQLDSSTPQRSREIQGGCYYKHCFLDMNV